jgi:hypothetical protein
MRALGILLIVAGIALVGTYFYLIATIPPLFGGPTSGGKAAIILLLPAYYLIQWGRNCLKAHDDPDGNKDEPLL